MSRRKRDKAAPPSGRRPPRKSRPAATARAADQSPRRTSIDWQELETLLQTPSTRSHPDASRVKELRDRFGETEFAYLRGLARRSALTRAQPKLGAVIVINGIMGSDLAVDNDGVRDVVWLNYWRLVRGRVEDLKLSPNGQQEADPSLKVVVSGLNEDVYTRLILYLRAHWTVEPFAFDWRKDIDEASAALADVIQKKFPGQPVHLVAHSMGGLVCRNFIRLYPDLWRPMRDAKGNGGRLIMMGTPNYGSFAIPLALTGEESLVRLLATADLFHNRNEITEILNTFVGSYQMLPAPSKLAGALQVLYQKSTWACYPAPISQQHLQRALAFHGDLESPATIDPERMAYIAGINQETPHDLKILPNGMFEYAMTLDGDGRVPHSLGLLKGVRTYYVEEGHGELPKHEKVCAAIHDICARGETKALLDSPPARRSADRAYRQWRSQIEEGKLTRQLQDIAEQVKSNTATPAEVRFAEGSLMRAALGMRQPDRIDGDGQGAPKPLPSEKRIPLTFRIVLGDITQVQAPLVVVGHYKGVLPVPGRAEGELDAALNSWISHATVRGMVGGNLGELFFIPVGKHPVAAEAVVLAGMGDMGKFTREDLRYLFSNIALAVSSRGDKAFATVLIGSGDGNLSRERAIRGMLDGLFDGLRRLPAGERLTEVRLVEVNRANHREILDVFHAIVEERTFPLFKLTVHSSKLARRRKAKARRAAAAASEIPNDPLPGARIAIERDGDVFRFSALTKEAVISVREVTVQSHLADETSHRVTLSEEQKDQEHYGRLLHTYLLPADFQRLIEDSDALTLVLDRSTASFPWEMACFKGAGRAIYFGPDLKLTRQFRTLLSSPPGVAPPLNARLRILVIADPAPETEWQLPGAREEGRAVVALLQDIQKAKGGVSLEIVDRIGASQCDPVDLLALILNGDFDVVHFAGHGVFDEKNPYRSGWIFGKDCILSAREIFRARSVPRLVFANACFSSVVKNGTPLATEMNKDLAGLAEAFFERGIANYIGAGWPVQDQQAVTFAQRFYTRAITQGAELGEAMAEARQAILHQGSTWGAYQHYGQVNAKLVDLSGRRRSD